MQKSDKVNSEGVTIHLIMPKTTYRGHWSVSGVVRVTTWILAVESFSLH